eukprot:gnl/TRDRNA2_/TRDRNA2_198887_c0_seq1.p1 gnl/TRDRNA2_/TRDRNA2_198887_c0~~gnl/TRDRNA2_/TRDRNA2_198887_c0_seq1.p1  ORF type:complete len:174 (-),score=69.46 gnl/TRDRNA2_/TRDRNA2_198887_c0_seq1:49-519(-)
MVRHGVKKGSAKDVRKNNYEQMLADEKKAEAKLKERSEKKKQQEKEVKEAKALLRQEEKNGGADGDIEMGGSSKGRSGGVKRTIDKDKEKRKPPKSVLVARVRAEEKKKKKMKLKDKKVKPNGLPTAWQKRVQDAKAKRLRKMRGNKDSDDEGSFE